MKNLLEFLYYAYLNSIQLIEWEFLYAIIHIILKSLFSQII